ncbi:MAG: M48 family metallopeptidase [Clostridia bacterium]|nr:M48 family metallopeptidase [Clostridia bacterium]
MKRAKSVIPPRVEYYAGIMGLSYEKVYIRLQKTRWGSCSSKKNLSFNALLALMPTEVLDSVIVHELAHLKYMNHQKLFWNLVYRYFPKEKYAACRKYLNSEGMKIMKEMGVR